MNAPSHKLSGGRLIPGKDYRVNEEGLRAFHGAVRPGQAIRYIGSQRNPDRGRIDAEEIRMFQTESGEYFGTQLEEAALLARYLELVEELPN